MLSSHNINNQNTNINIDIEMLYLDVLCGFLLRNENPNSVNHKNTRLDFISSEELQDVNSLRVKMFLDEIRSAYQDQYVKNFLEVLLYPISNNPAIDLVLLGSLLDNGYISVESEQILNELKNSKQALKSFRKFIVAIEDNSLNKRSISTNLNYKDFKEKFLSRSTKSVNDRMILLAYFLTNLMEHLLVNDLNKMKQNKLKQLIKYMTTNELY